MRIGMIILLVMLYSGLLWLLLLGYKRKKKSLYITSGILSLLAVVATVFIIVFYW